MRKVAICPRVNGSSGQYRAGSIAHPAVTPAAARGVDAGGLTVTFGVDKTGRWSRLEFEGPGEEGGHLSPGHRIVRAKADRIGRTSQDDPQLGEPFHIGRPPHVGVHIGEMCRHSRG